MYDLFPGSLQPEALGFSAITRMATCFFAIYPGAEFLDLIVRIQHEHCRRSGLPFKKWLRAEMLHVSVAQWNQLRLLGRLEDVLHSVREQFSSPGFDIRLSSVTRFNGRNGEHSLVFEADAETRTNVTLLRRDMARAGLLMDAGTISPHLTIGYGRGIPMDRVPIEPICFPATSVEMIVSRDRTHHHLDRWSLR